MSIRWRPQCHSVLTSRASIVRIFIMKIPSSGQVLSRYLWKCQSQVKYCVVVYENARHTTPQGKHCPDIYGNARHTPLEPKSCLRWTEWENHDHWSIKCQESLSSKHQCCKNDFIRILIIVENKISISNTLCGRTERGAKSPWKVSNCPNQPIRSDFAVLKCLISKLYFLLQNLISKCPSPKSTNPIRLVLVLVSLALVLGSGLVILV